jgi:DNA-binding transcriptional ArsR family regulator
MPSKRPGQVVLSDPAAIKALAHPARLAVLDQLAPDAQLTATELAAGAGLSPSAMSYHLRALAKWGIVVEAEGTDGRERRWKLHPGGFMISPAHPAASAAAESTVVSNLLERQRRAVAQWFAQQVDEGDGWRDAALVTSSHIWLTLEELEALNQAVADRITELRGRTSESRPAGARRIMLSYLAVPQGPSTPS